MCGGTVPENSLVHQDIQHQSFMSLCHGIFRIYFQFQTHYRIKKLSGVCVLSKNHYILGDYIMNHTYRTWIFHYTEMGKSLRIIYIYINMCSLQLSTFSTDVEKLGSQL